MDSEAFLEEAPKLAVLAGDLEVAPKLAVLAVDPEADSGAFIELAQWAV